MAPFPSLENGRVHSLHYETTDDLFNDPEEPVYLLSLDGGGVRGISEAVILHEIMLRIQRKLGLRDLPKPCDYFHLIGGTSTGGLIALMLGRMRMSTREVIQEYETIARQIFSFWNRRLDMSFRKTKLEQCVKSIVASRVDEGDRRMISNENGIKKGLSFVVSLRKGEDADVNIPTLFRSYKGMNESPDCEIWEAARATTAAPRYFAASEITLKGKKQYFVDGALKFNNPTKVLLEEAESYFGHHRTLGCLVSLGTGLRPSPLKEKGGGAFGKSYSFTEVLKMAADILTDPEGVHQATEDRLKGHQDSYFRFSVPYVEGQERIRIHEYKRMRALREDTEKYLKQRLVSDKLDELVDVLTKDKATDLTLQAACHANSTETAMGQVVHKLQHRKTTSPNFTGRWDILDSIDEFFERRPSSAYPRRDVWLYGPPGIGKTQIALYFIDIYRPIFDKVLWIDATMPYNSFEFIATQVLEHPPKGRNLIPAVINWLESTKEEWLLVIDGYDSGDLTPLLPNFGKGNVLFTSTRLDLRPDSVKGVCMMVPEMSLSDSISLLLRAAKKDTKSEALRAQAEPVAIELGMLPLALDQAGVSIGQKGCSFQEYLFNLRQNRKDLLQDPNHKEGSPRELAVYATFDHSLKHLRRYATDSAGDTQKTMAYKSALEILNIFCFYQQTVDIVQIITRARFNLKMRKRSDDIWSPMDIADDKRIQTNGNSGKESTESGEALEPIVQGLSPRTGLFDFDYLIAGIYLLVRFSLLNISPLNHRIFEFRPLVQTWLRDRMDPGTFQANFRLARTLLFHAFHRKFRDSQSERFHRTLLPHMQANNSLLVEEESRGEPSQEDTEIKYKYATVLGRARLWEKSVPVLEQVIQGLSLSHGLDATNTLNGMLGLGTAYMAVNRLDDAHNTLREVIDRGFLSDCGYEEMGPVATALGLLSMVSLIRGDLPSAHAMSVEAYSMARRWKRRHVYHLARVCLVYQYLTWWEKAEELAETMVKENMGCQSRGPEHLETLKFVVYLARIRAQRGKTDLAARDLADVAARFETDLGPRDLDTVAAKSDLAWVYYLQGEDGLEKAEELQQETLKTGRSEFGDMLPYTLLMIMRLGLTVGARGRIEEAVVLLQECHRGREAVFGPKHKATLGAGAAEILLLDKRDGDYFERLRIPREKAIREAEIAKGWAEFPYMFVQM